MITLQDCIAMCADEHEHVPEIAAAALAQYFDLDGAFNSVSLKLLPGTSEREAIKQLDDLLARYGGTGASARKDQLSHAFLDAELRQLDALWRTSFASFDR